MRRGLALGALIALLSSASTRAVAQTAPQAPLLRIGREQLCVTNGTVQALPDGRLAIDTPSSRAVVRIATEQTAEVRFRYLGPSKDSKPLASGELRRQIGLKLKAQDTCNLVYAMWHIEPDSKFAVSIKRNPDEHTHAECRAGGYVTIKARSAVDLPRIQPGESHRLRAALRGDALTLVADGTVVWEGTLGSQISTFDGPVGLRTDNARFEFEYYAGSPRADTGSNALDEHLHRCSVDGEG
ncbi:MAG TPA: hypothetical protein DEP35_20315 [Deltaproteobacteria bacterium]|jgi:hypothetical protein|nr:hypothetical protein [Deltaproteobacteria bacterium]